MIDLFKRKLQSPVERSSATICVWGPIGSPGKTTFAVNLACELAIEGKRVLLIDLDTYAPTIAHLLGLADEQPGLAASVRLVGQGRLDLEQIERLSTSYEVGSGTLSILAGLGSSARWPEISKEKAESLIAIAAEHFDHVIVDLASPLEQGTRLIGGVVERNSATHAALRVCDLAIAVFAADPIGVGRLLAVYDQLAEIRDDAILVANRLRPSALGARARQQIADTVQEFCRRDVVAFIESDIDSCDRAVLESVPLAMMKRSSKARQGIAQFARLSILNRGSHAGLRVAKLD